jgi:tRNA-dihydrouridine synthase B
MDEVESIVMEHVRELHQFYGDFMGVRIARKHVSWYVQKHEQGREFRSRFNELETVEHQLESLTDYFKNLTK